MRSIWKFPLEFTDHQEVLMPFGARPICVQMQNGQITLWAEVETSNTPDGHTSIFICGTGRRVPPEATTYIGTVQQDPFVWHVYH